MNQVQHDLGRIREYLDASTLGPEGRLPPERELADILGLTRSRLRTGLRKLAAEGTIWRHVGKGTFFGSSLGMSPIPFGKSVQDFTNPREVMTARLAIEPALSRLSAVHATGRDLIEIRSCLNAMATLKDWRDWDRLDHRLHRAIALGAHNALMLLIFDTVHANRNKELWGRLREPIEPADAIERAAHGHNAIVEALVDRNADAAETAMRTHLRAVERRIFGSIE